MALLHRFDPAFHHRRSIRLKGYDYSRRGCYFITLCTAERGAFFGKISNGIMTLNDFGLIAFNEWIRTPILRPGIELGEFIIMPNHMHAIIIIRENITGANSSPLPVRAGSGPLPVRAGSSPLPVRAGCSPPQPNLTTPPPIPPAGIVGAIVRGYKATVTKQVNTLRGKPGCPVWQRNYYERIIRDKKAYVTISRYIRQNPVKWNKDKFFE